jgi:CTP:molybdopterin cytidylyltransferase MocA
MADAVVLAGGSIPDREADFRDAVGVPCKSLIPLSGRIMASYVAHALKGAQAVNRVAVVGAAALQGHPDLAGIDRVLPEAAGRSENLFLALDAFSDSDRIVMMTSDTPLVTPEMVDDILAHLPPEVDLGYVLVRKETVLAKFADRPAPPPDDKGRRMPNWVTVAVRDGSFTGTGCLIIKPEAARRCREFIKGVFDDREMGHVVSVLKPLFGMCFLIRIALVMKCPCFAWLLSIADIENRLSKGLGIACRAYISPNAEMAFDVDHATDVPIAEGVLASR